MKWMTSQEAIGHLEHHNLLWRAVQERVAEEAEKLQDSPALSTPGAVIDWLERQGLHLYVSPKGAENSPASGEDVALIDTEKFDDLTGHREGEYLS